MSAAPTWQDYYNTGLAECRNDRGELLVAPGDLSDMLLAAAAAIADHLTGYAADRFQATYLDGASGDDLTTLADDHWNVQRKQAVPASVQLSLSRASAAAGAGTVPAGTEVATTKDAFGNEVRFITLVDVNWGASQVGSQLVNGQAEVAGVAGNVGAGMVARIVSTLFDSTIVVTNPSAAAGGADQETDQQLRDRVRLVPLTYRRGTKDAITFGVKNDVAGVVVVTVVEDSTGIITVYVSDVNGNTTPLMLTQVANSIEAWRAAGSLVSVVGAALLNIPSVQLHLTTKAGYDPSTVLSNIQNAVAARSQKLGAGDTLFMSMIKQTVIAIDPDNILDCAVNVPASDQIPAASQIIRISPSAVSLV